MMRRCPAVVVVVVAACTWLLFTAKKLAIDADAEKKIC